jgi:hypothetical protein
VIVLLLARMMDSGNCEANVAGKKVNKKGHGKKGSNQEKRKRKSTFTTCACDD